MRFFFCLLLIFVASFAQIGSKVTVGTTISLLNDIERANVRALSTYTLPVSSGEKLEILVEDFYYKEGILSLSGRVADSEESSVMLKGDKTSLYGWIHLRAKNRAFEYTTDEATRQVTVEEVLESQIFSIENFPTIPESEHQPITKNSETLHNFSIPNAPHIGPYPGTNVNKLQSFPSASKVLYLDITRIMDGETPKHYTKEGMWELFKCVAGGYSCFQLNVTTDADVYAKAGVTNSGILRFLDENGRSFSYVKIFGTTKFSTVYKAISGTPNALKTGRTAWHESGHLMAVLDYGGPAGTTYFVGFPTYKWVPIMGNFWMADPWGANALQQWSKGEYETATVTSDFLDLVSKICPFRDDDIPQSKALQFTEGSTKIAPEKNYGQICPNTDSDAFTFDIKGEKGHATLTIDRIEEILGGSMLDIDASIVDASGKVIAQNNAQAVRKAQLDVDLPAGKYSLIVKGGAEGTPKKGFSTYGSLGFYAISGDITGGATSITAAHIVQKSFSLYPITTKGNVVLSIPNKYTIEEISVFSSDGRNVFTTKENVRVFNISHAAPGIYLIAVKLYGSHVLGKLVKV